MLAALAQQLDLPDVPQRHRVLRHQPHGRRGHGRLLRRVRPGGSAEEGVPALQHHRASRRATTTARCARRSGAATTRIKDGEVPAPDLLLIDGGLGQINEVHDELAAAGIRGAHARRRREGPGSPRRAGAAVHPWRGRATHPGPHSPALRLVQRIRDEAHRFAITGHRNAARAATTNPCSRRFRAWARRSAARCSSISAACRE